MTLTSWKTLAYQKCILNSNVGLFIFQTIPVEILMRFTSLLTGVLGCYCYAGILTEEEARKLDFFQKAKVEHFHLS